MHWKLFHWLISLQVCSSKLDVSEIRAIETGLGKVIKKCQTQNACEDAFLKLLSTYSAGAMARDAIDKYESLGPNGPSRVERDSNSLNLLATGRHVTAFFKTVRTTNETMESTKQGDVYKDATPFVQVALNTDPGSAFSSLKTAVIAEAIALSCKACAGQVSAALSALKATSNGMEANGDNDWKREIKNPMNLDEVIEIAGATLAKMDGKALGNKILGL